MTGAPVTLLPCGPRAVLLEVADLAAVLRVDAAVRTVVEGGQPPWDRVIDVVPAARTVLLTLAGSNDLAAVARGVIELARAVLREGAPASPPDQDHVVELPVVYDGPDLDDVASLVGLSTQEVVTAHTGTLWQVAFGGFAPGFAYLTGGDPRLTVPRRTEPRTSVPTGAVALAGPFSGVYPRSSPGGWQLIGRTETVLWDERRDPPALLRPGWNVRFVERPAL
ncbi:MAG: allophanate hydrolase subunit 1 [Austwickia sp.]|jgi:KipI family sensor histidine kinase inhibitor|nr:allophanate hydrolase subunit 1 [Austwickia sp.]MBK8437125.1 allophanate hydrolase subunit 1 [Austwickia sp.]MBK9102360.1 allophanate hydrolase subunit 1 [Austwickia sp.]